MIEERNQFVAGVVAFGDVDLDRLAAKRPRIVRHFECLAGGDAGGRFGRPAGFAGGRAGAILFLKEQPLLEVRYNVPSVPRISSEAPS